MVSSGGQRNDWRADDGRSEAQLGGIARQPLVALAAYGGEGLGVEGEYRRVMVRDASVYTVEVKANSNGQYRPVAVVVVGAWLTVQLFRSFTKSVT